MHMTCEYTDWNMKKIPKTDVWGLGVIFESE
jgi:hypothetical protein